MLDDRLSSLARLTIESELLRSIDCEDMIQEFAKLKIRKNILTKSQLYNIFFYPPPIQPRGALEGLITPGPKNLNPNLPVLETVGCWGNSP